MASPTNDRWAQVDTSLVREGKSRGYRVVTPKPQMPQNRRWDRGLFAQPDVQESVAAAQARGAEGARTLWNMEAQQLPLQAAMIAAAATGGGMGMLPALQRITAAGGAALPASLAGQAMQGNVPSVEQTQRDVLMNVGGQAGGEGLAGLAGLVGRGFAGLATRVTPAMKEKFPGINLADELLNRGIGSPSEATAAREASAREARKAATLASRKKKVTFEPARIPEQTDMIVPGVVASAEGGYGTPSAGITDLAAASAREAAARSALHDIASKAGYDDAEFVSLLSNPSPNPADLAEAFRRGLRANDLAAAREHLANVGAEAATLGEATPQQWVSSSQDVVFTPTRDMVMPREPNALRPKVSRKVAYSAEQFVKSPEIQRLSNQLKNAGEPAKELSDLEAFLSDWQAQHQGRKSPIDWYRQAQSLQRESKPFYGRGAAGVGQQVASSPTQQAAKAALAAAIKRELAVQTPAIKARDAETQALIALERALKRNDTIVQKGGGLAGMAAGDVAVRAMGHAGVGAEIPAALTGAFLGHAASSPTVLANAALLLRSPSVQSAIANNPKLLMALLQSNELMAQEGGQ